MLVVDEVVVVAAAAAAAEDFAVAAAATAAVIDAVPQQVVVRRGSGGLGQDGPAHGGHGLRDDGVGSLLAGEDLDALRERRKSRGRSTNLDDVVDQNIDCSTSAWSDLTASHKSRICLDKSFEDPSKKSLVCSTFSSPNLGSPRISGFHYPKKSLGQR